MAAKIVIVAFVAWAALVALGLGYLAYRDRRAREDHEIDKMREKRTEALVTEQGRDRIDHELERERDSE